MPSVRPFHSLERQSLASEYETSETLLTIQTESDEQHNPNREGCRNMRITPRVSATRPIERQKHQSSAQHEQEAAHRIASPRQIFERHLRVISTLLGPIGCEDTQRSSGMESGLYPEDIAPTGRAKVRHGTGR
jgi:hypothetical protein